MSTNLIASIDRLPVEIFHRIFDSLDAETIVLSVRLVSRLLRDVVYSYNRYDLDFELMGKSNFYRLCQVIRPENIISLKLSDDERTSNQIDLFLTLVNFQECIRLRSLSLLAIKEKQLNCICKWLSFDMLTSFSLRVTKSYNNEDIDENIRIPIIAQTSLRNLSLDLKTKQIFQIANSWPVNCSIQSLTINNNISIIELCTILDHCPFLYTLVLNEFSSQYLGEYPSSKQFRQLKSLILEKIHVNMDELEAFLLLTPAIVYLKLIGCLTSINAKRFEQLFQNHLAYLDKFEFFFENSDHIYRTIQHIETLVTSFRTPFWLEHKHWYVTCEYDKPRLSKLYLYTIPICKSFLLYNPTLEKYVSPIDSTIIDDDLAPFENVTSLELPLCSSLVEHIEVKKATAVPLLFPHVTKISLEIQKDWYSFPLDSLSTLINISQITKITWNSYFINGYDRQQLMDIRIFLDQAYNLSFLIFSYISYASSQTISDICSIVPNHIKHLQIAVDHVNQIKIIFKQCQHLLTVTFDLKRSDFSTQVIDWFAKNTINSSLCTTSKTVTVWLGKHRN